MPPVVEQDVVGVEVLDEDLPVVQGGQHLARFIKEKYLDVHTED